MFRVRFLHRDGWRRWWRWGTGRRSGSSSWNRRTSQTTGGGWGGRGKRWRSSLNGLIFQYMRFFREHTAHRGHTHTNPHSTHPRQLGSDPLPPRSLIFLRFLVPHCCCMMCFFKRGWGRGGGGISSRKRINTSFSALPLLTLARLLSLERRLRRRASHTRERGRPAKLDPSQLGHSLRDRLPLRRFFIDVRISLVTAVGRWGL